MCHRRQGRTFYRKVCGLFLGLIHLDLGSAQRSKVEVAPVLAASAADCKKEFLVSDLEAENKIVAFVELMLYLVFPIDWDWNIRQNPLIGVT